jgi:hypothetical protein
MGEWLALFNSYRVPAQHLSSFLLAAAIWRWGAGPERWLIGSFIGTMVLPVYMVWWLGLGALETGPHAPIFMAIDMLAAVLFTTIALNANRNYPLWIAGFQLVAVGAHIVKTLVDSVSPLAVAVLVIGPSYFQIVLLAGGFFRHAQRQRRFGRYREWRVPTSLAGGGIRL